MSSMVTTNYHRHGMLDELPVELVVHIMKQSPSLSALWSFMNASARLAAIFRGAALEITEAVLQRTVPDQTRCILRAEIRLRSSILPPSLDAATRFAELCDPLGPAPGTTPEVLRSFIRLARKIHTLAHECIDHYIGVCMAMNPSLLDGPLPVSYTCIRPFEARYVTRPKGRPYQPKDTGPPSWAEEQLVEWNLWRVQYYYDIRAAHHVGRLVWSVAEQDELLSVTVPAFYRIPTHWLSYRHEQLMTVLAYVEGVKRSEMGTSRPFYLPCPSAPGRFDFGCSFEPLKAPPRRRGPPSVEFQPPGFVFAGIMSGSLKSSPLYGFTLRNFRKFGFALWEKRRMVDLGLISPKNVVPCGEYYFRWHSILSDEECDPANADPAILARAPGGLYIGDQFS